MWRWFSYMRSLVSPYSNPMPICRTLSRKVDNNQDLLENPYFEKYAEKIAGVQKLSQPEDFQKMLEENLKLSPGNMRSKNTVSSQQHSKKSSIPFSKKQKDLNQIMKLDAVKQQTAEEIEMIWKQYHQVKDGVYAVLPGSAYEKLCANFNLYPVFLFPLPRAMGYEFIMCQYMEQSIYFTSLLNYQTFKENAPAILTVTYFTELVKEKGIVLMRGEYNSNELKAYEAQCLTNQLQLYYGESSGSKLELVQRFNQHPATFKHMDLISNFESSIGKSV